MKLNQFLDKILQELNHFITQHKKNIIKDSEKRNAVIEIATLVFSLANVSWKQNNYLEQQFELLAKHGEALPLLNDKEIKSQEVNVYKAPQLFAELLQKLQSWKSFSKDFQSLLNEEIGVAQPEKKSKHLSLWKSSKNKPDLDLPGDNKEKSILATLREQREVKRKSDAEISKATLQINCATSLGNVPQDVKVLIISFIDAKTISSLAQATKLFWKMISDAAYDKQIWGSLFSSSYGYLAQDRNGDESYRQAFIRLQSESYITFYFGAKDTIQGIVDFANRRLKLRLDGYEVNATASDKIGIAESYDKGWDLIRNADSDLRTITPYGSATLVQVRLPINQLKNLLAKHDSEKILRYAQSMYVCILQSWEIRS